MEFAITTDYLNSVGCPEAALRAIAAAGWHWIHWCHQWDSDFLYGRHEWVQIKAWLAELDLRVLDIHGSAGREKNWGALREYERLAGVELVTNRVQMAATLGCDVVIMHAPTIPTSQAQGLWDCFRRSLDELEPICRKAGVRLALENMAIDNFATLAQIMDSYSPSFLGVCYDAGHGQIAGNGLDRLSPLTSRLIALHLHDNDGQKDWHQPPLMGRVDWPRLAAIVVTSGYQRPAMTVEAVIQHSGIQDEATFLCHTLKASQAFGVMLQGRA